MLAGAINELAQASEFRAGLLVGAALATGTLLLVVGRRPRRVVPIGGSLIALGFALGLAVSSNLPLGVAIGAALLAAGGFVAGRTRGRMGVALVLAVPGAVVLSTHAGRPRHAWIELVTGFVIVVASPLVADFDRRFARAGWPLALYAISTAGVYFTVPDTERALVLLGVSMPLVFLGWPAPFGSLGAGGASAAIGVLMWTAAFESRGREASLVGAIGCLALLVAEPCARLLGRRRATLLSAVPHRPWSITVVGALHLAAVFVASRVAGLRASVAEAVIIVAFELTSSVLVLRAANVSAPLSRPSNERSRTARRRRV